MSAQAIPAGGEAASHESELHESPVKGINGTFQYAAQHTSDTGWANIVTPTLSYRFNPHVFVDATVPVYLTLNANVETTKAGVTTYPLKSGTHLLGDTVLEGHLEWKHEKLSTVANATLGLPTGNARFGLSANTETYNVTGHVDYELGPFSPDVEVGFGNSSALANQQVRKSYVAVGPVSNFQAGTWIDLPWNMGLDLEAYEDLPLGNQNVYGTVTRKNKKGKTVSKQVLEGTGVAEDNGFNTELDVPIGRHMVINGTYERSLVQALDTVSVGVTFTLRGAKISKAK